MVAKPERVVVILGPNHEIGIAAAQAFIRKRVVEMLQKQTKSGA